MSQVKGSSKKSMLRWYFRISVFPYFRETERVETGSVSCLLSVLRVLDVWVCALCAVLYFTIILKLKRIDLDLFYSELPVIFILRSLS
jgi:hypothetical protein